MYKLLLILKLKEVSNVTPSPNGLTLESLLSDFIGCTMDNTTMRLFFNWSLTTCDLKGLNKKSSYRPVGIEFRKRLCAALVGKCPLKKG